MKFLLGLIFMIPLCFFSYWMFLYSMYILTFLFMVSMKLMVFYSSISYFLGNDLLSFSLVLLSLWICSLMVLASEKIFKFKNFNKLFLFVILFLVLSLVVVFSSLNFFVFYLFFEISLIPTLFLIIGWGYQPERISAGIYLLFYTLLVSLPMMISLFYLYKIFISMDFYFFIYSIDSIFLYYCVNMVFLVKIPIFYLHLWLPKAHVEAPISGSMILAGVMLKLGGYGLLRMMKVFMKIGMKINIYFIIISLIGGLIISLMCIRQSDMKSLIAYSSVAHMGVVLSGMMTMNLMGAWGALAMMLAHGLCSSGLFCLANISYERVLSRSVYLNKGMINILPSLSLWWFLLCSSNMAAPPSLNLMGEILLINSLMAYSSYFFLILFSLSFMSGVYSLFLYSFTQHGQFSFGLYSFYQVNYREFMLLFLHWFPLNMILLKSELFMWI
uniref:NADH-ubiquinone oxidoreductase chain 4 n=1 Tax=Aegorhinus superciliosus TaxID=1448030 RepID=A0A0K0K9I2_9CUCU|nr:NADH dehydrogenase subunit 4 [Aegorhinus superciliosus]AHG32669.1 NADH dehydrogenase subunit 4 [Aegorhinus superciliosus]